MIWLESTEVSMPFFVIHADRKERMVSILPRFPEKTKKHINVAKRK